MAKHAKLSPSASERWLNCPGSISLSETVPRPPSSKYATEGTAAHTLLERYLNGSGEYDINDKFIEADGEDIPVTEEMHHAVAMAANYTIDAGDAQIWAEERVCASSIDPELWGSTDAAIWHEDIGMLEVIDFKYGYTPVEVTRNSQLRIYAIGFVDSHIEDWSQVEFVKYTIIQPRATHPKGPIRSEMMSAAAVRAFKINTKAAIALTKANEPVLKTGDWCRYCPVALAAACPKKNEEAMSVFKKIKSGELDDAGTSEAGMATVMNMVATLEAWCKQVSGATKAHIESGEDVPGWKVVDGRATRKWDNEEATLKYFKGRIKDKAYIVKLKSPAQMEKVAPKDEVNALCTATSTTTALVASSDPRPAKQFKPLFEALS